MPTILHLNPHSKYLVSQLLALNFAPKNSKFTILIKILAFIGGFSLFALLYSFLKHRKQ